SRDWSSDVCSSDLPVARQPVGPLLVPGRKSLLDQQAAEAGAVDEQIGGDNFPAFEKNRLDEAAVTIEPDVHDLPFRPHNAARFGILPQVSRVQTGIELVRVRVGGERRREVLRGMGKPALPGSQDRQRILFDRTRKAELPRANVMMMKVDTGKVTAECAEGVNVAVANPGPVAKFNAKLERRAGARHEDRK